MDFQIETLWEGLDLPVNHSWFRRHGPGITAMKNIRIFLYLDIFRATNFILKSAFSIFVIDLWVR